jgi:hypothetical protein
MQMYTFFSALYEYQPDDDPSASKHGTVKISKNKVVLKVFAYLLIM